MVSVSTPIPLKAAEPQMSKYSQLAASLKGQTIRVPNLDHIFKGWSLNLINPNYSDLKPFVNEKIESLGYADCKLDRFKTADFALFVSCWWPKAELDVCKTISLWIIWLFVWDDEIEMEKSISDNNLADEFRDNPCQFIKYSLGLERRGSCPEPQSAIVKSFGEFSERLRKCYDYEQLKMFSDEAITYFKKTRQEQEIKGNDELPSLEKFWEMRMGSSGTKPCLVLAEAAIGTKLPRHLMKHPDMEILWDKTTIGISISNDIFSLKKELLSDAVLNVVPLTYADCNSDIQLAVDKAIETLRISVIDFNEAAERLLLETVEGTSEHEVLANYIQVLQTNQTGHHYWSLRSGRYFLEGALQKDGSLKITL